MNNLPTRERTNYPLLFDREDKPKSAFEAVLKVGGAHQDGSSRRAEGTLPGDPDNTVTPPKENHR